MVLEIINNIENHQIAVALIFTVFLLLIFEYIKFYIDIPSPLFFKHKELLADLSIYLSIQIVVSILMLFILCGTSIFNCEYPLNIFYVAFTSSFFAAGIINNIELYLSEDETKNLNKFRDVVKKFRNELLKNIKQLETADLRKMGKKFEDLFTLDELKQECKRVFQEKYNELETKFVNEKSSYAWEIIKENPKHVKNLISGRS